nr:uroporphyrinogen decarboxylase family protein [uncultured Desulfobacter sp.]
MNHAERIMATMQGMPTDRRALVLVMSLYAARLTACPLDEHYTNPDVYFRGQVAVQKKFEPDVLFSPFVLPYMGAAFGSEIKLFKNQAPNIATPAIKRPEDFASLPVPNVDSNFHLSYIRKCLKLLVKEYGKNIPVGAFALSPVDLPAMIMGMEAWLETMLFKQDLAEQIIEQVTPHFIEYTNALFSDGVSFIVLPLPFANLRIITPKIAREITVPKLKNTFEQVAGPLILHHVGASFLNSLEHLQDLPNVMGYYIGKEDSLVKAREIVGPQKILLGNIDGPGLRKKTVEDIQHQTRNILGQTKDDPCFILATSSPDIDIDTPEENIFAIVNAVKEFSRRKDIGSP